MMTFSIPGLIFLSSLLVLLTWYLLDALLRKEDFVTDKINSERIAQFLKTYVHSNLVFYDLGSSRGDFAIFVSKNVPNLAVTGIDNSLIRVWLSKLKARILKSRARFAKGDIFKADLSKADLVYVYVPRALLPGLAKKLEKEMRQNTLVITSRIFFEDWKADKVFAKSKKGEEDIFVYKAPFAISVSQPAGFSASWRTGIRVSGQI